MTRTIHLQLIYIIGDEDLNELANELGVDQRGDRFDILYNIFKYLDRETTRLEPGDKYIVNHPQFREAMRRCKNDQELYEALIPRKIPCPANEIDEDGTLIDPIMKTTLPERQEDTIVVGKYCYDPSTLQNFIEQRDYNDPITRTPIPLEYIEKYTKLEIVRIMARGDHTALKNYLAVHREMDIDLSGMRDFIDSIKFGMHLTFLYHYKGRDARNKRTIGGMHANVQSVAFNKLLEYVHDEVEDMTSAAATVLIGNTESLLRFAKINMKRYDELLEAINQVVSMAPLECDFVWRFQVAFKNLDDLHEINFDNPSFLLYSEIPFSFKRRYLDNSVPEMIRFFNQCYGSYQYYGSPEYRMRNSRDFVEQKLSKVKDLIKAWINLAVTVLKNQHFLCNLCLAMALSFSEEMINKLIEQDLLLDRYGYYIACKILAAYGHIDVAFKMAGKMSNELGRNYIEELYNFVVDCANTGVCIPDRISKYFQSIIFQHMNYPNTRKIRSHKMLEAIGFEPNEYETKLLNLSFENVDPEFIKFGMDKGWDLYILNKFKDATEEQLIEFLARNKNPKLLENNSYFLQIAIKLNSVRAIKMAINCGANPSIKDYFSFEMCGVHGRYDCCICMIDPYVDEDVDLEALEVVIINAVLMGNFNLAKRLAIEFNYDFSKYNRWLRRQLDQPKYLTDEYDELRILTAS